MLDAVHKNTGKPYHNYEVPKIFEKPGNEEWICCPICKKPVSYVKAHKRKFNGKDIPVVMHFRIKNAETGGCISGESDEHRNAKVLLATLLENKEIKIQYENIVFGFDDLKIKDVPKIPFRWEQTRENRRADILFEFKEWHPMLGKGINFEIQRYSQTEEAQYNRENDWIKQGYSVSWIPIKCFNEYSFLDDNISISVVWFNRIFQIKYNELSEKIILFEEKYEEKLNEFNNVKFNILYPESIRLCKNCSRFKVNRRLSDSYICYFERTHATLPDSTCSGWKPKNEVL